MFCAEIVEAVSVEFTIKLFATSTPTFNELTASELTSAFDANI